MDARRMTQRDRMTRRVVWPEDENTLVYFSLHRICFQKRFLSRDEKHDLIYFLWART